MFYHFLSRLKYDFTNVISFVVFFGLLGDQVTDEEHLQMSCDWAIPSLVKKWINKGVFVLVNTELIGYKNVSKQETDVNEITNLMRGN